MLSKEISCEGWNPYLTRPTNSTPWMIFKKWCLLLLWLFISPSTIYTYRQLCRHQKPADGQMGGSGLAWSNDYKQSMNCFACNSQGKSSFVFDHVSQMTGANQRKVGQLLGTRAALTTWVCEFLICQCLCGSCHADKNKSEMETNIADKRRE